MTESKIKETLEKLFRLHQLGVKFGLDNTIGFLKELGNPHLNLKCFHIAGSNGKGSTSSFIASILMECGHKTGLYTSPHFVRFNERIKINGAEIDDEYVVNFYNQNAGYIEEKNLTFFETTTCMAFKYFADSNVDYAVIETGLGGRLDSTNVIDPLASVITSISLEHTNILGHSIDQITSEKAEIIKSGGKTFIGKLPEIAVNIIENKCKTVDNQLFILNDFIIERAEHIELYTEELDIDRLESPLPGNYQRLNAALAILAVYETLDFADENIFVRAVKNVIKNTGIQGRFEYAHLNPYVILDSAHNPEGITNFLSEFEKHNNKFNRRTLLFTALKDKNIREMIQPLKSAFNEIVITTIENERAETAEQIAKIASEYTGNYRVSASPEAEVTNFFVQAKENDCLVILGSMYLVGRIKEHLEKNKNNINNKF